MEHAEVVVLPKRCIARSKSTGERCKKAPITGGTVCLAHGGGAAQVRAAGARNAALAKAQRYADVDDGPRTPAEVYRELQRTAGIVVSLRDEMLARVETLNHLRYTSAIGTEQTRAEYGLLLKLIDQTVSVGKTIAALDLDTRLASIARTQGDMVSTALRRALDAGNLSDNQRRAVEERLAVELRAVTAEEA